MPNAIANSPSPFDVPDARTLKHSSSTSSVRIGSSRFVEALQEAEREPSRKIEKKPLPPVDEPLDHGLHHADDIDLLTPSTAERPQAHAAKDASPNVDPALLPISQDGRPTKGDPKTDSKTTDRLRRRVTDARTAAAALPTTAAAKLAMRAAGSDALLQAVQHHVRVAVQNEARTSGTADERAAKLHTPSTTPAPVPEATAAPHEVVTEVQAVQTDQQVTSSTTTSSSSSEPTAMGARENAALDHVQAIMQDPASQLFFDGRRAVLTLDGMTMRITSTGEGQASVEVTAVDAAAADRLQSQRGQLVEGLQQEGIALTKLDVAHDTGASTSQDRQQKRAPEPVDFDEPRKPTTVTTTTSATTTTLRAGVIKA